MAIIGKRGYSVVSTVVQSPSVRSSIAEGIQPDGAEKGPLNAVDGRTGGRAGGPSSLLTLERSGPTATGPKSRSRSA